MCYSLRRAVSMLGHGRTNSNRMIKRNKLVSEVCLICHGSVIENLKIKRYISMLDISNKIFMKN